MFSFELECVISNGRGARGGGPIEICFAGNRRCKGHVWFNQQKYKAHIIFGPNHKGTRQCVYAFRMEFQYNWNGAPKNMCMLWKKFKWFDHLTTIIHRAGGCFWQRWSTKMEINITTGTVLTSWARIYGQFHLKLTIGLKPKRKLSRTLGILS